METDKRKQTIKFYVAVTVLVLILIIIAIIMIKYEVEGEQNMPFKLSKIIVVSTAEGVEQQGTDKKWAFNIFQNNDIYFYIDKNNEYKSEKQMYIDSVSIENIEVINSPQIGEIKAYMPNSSEGRMYSYAEDSIVDEVLKYNGATRSNSRNLKIGNQGGNIAIRFSNTGIGKYESNDDEQIVHDGTLIKKLEKTTDDIKFTVNFDFIIVINKNKYKAKITLDLPCGNIVENGTANYEKSDMKDIIFKREK